MSARRLDLRRDNVVLYDGWFNVCGFSAALNQQERSRSPEERSESDTMVRARLVGDYDSAGHGSCWVEVCEFDMRGNEAWIAYDAIKHEGIREALMARLALQRMRVLKLLATLTPEDNCRPHSSWVRERLEWEGGE